MGNAFYDRNLETFLYGRKVFLVGGLSVQDKYGES